MTNPFHWKELDYVINRSLDTILFTELPYLHLDLFCENVINKLVWVQWNGFINPTSGWNCGVRWWTVEMPNPCLLVFHPTFTMPVFPDLIKAAILWHLLLCISDAFYFQEALERSADSLCSPVTVRASACALHCPHTVSPDLHHWSRQQPHN